MNIECSRLAPAFIFQCLDRKLGLPLGYQISQEGVASERFALRDAQGKIDQKVALEGIRLEDVGPSAIQSKVVFTNLSEIVAKQPMRAFERQTAGLCDLYNHLQSWVLVCSRKIRQQILYRRFAAFVHSKGMFVEWPDSSKHIADVHQGASDFAAGNRFIHCRVSSSTGLNMTTEPWQ